VLGLAGFPIIAPIGALCLLGAISSKEPTRKIIYGSVAAASAGVILWSMCGDWKMDFGFRI